jgi:hypothetical protein
VIAFQVGRYEATARRLTRQIAAAVELVFRDENRRERAYVA